MRFDPAEFEAARAKRRRAVYIVLAEAEDGMMRPLYPDLSDCEYDGMPFPDRAAWNWAVQVQRYVQIWKLPENICAASAFPQPWSATPPWEA